MNYDTAKLRQFINQHFGPHDLNDLLFDYFRMVHDDLMPGMTKRQQLSLLLEFCDRHGKFPDLLAAIGRERPFFQPDDYVPGKKAPAAAPPTPAPSPATRAKSSSAMHIKMWRWHGAWRMS